MLVVLSQLLFQNIAVHLSHTVVCLPEFTGYRFSLPFCLTKLSTLVQGTETINTLI